MGMQSIMAVWAGYSLGGQTVAQGGLAAYIEQSRQQVNGFILRVCCSNSEHRHRLNLLWGRPARLEVRAYGVMLMQLC
jgi:hypothetical protein